MFDIFICLYVIVMILFIACIVLDSISEVIKDFREERLTRKYGRMRYFVVYFDDEVNGLKINARSYEALKKVIEPICLLNDRSCVIYELPYEDCEDVGLWIYISKLWVEEGSGYEEN